MNELSSAHAISNGKREALWQSYCGFLDLSPGEFMAIQRRRLAEQLALLQASPMAGTVLPTQLPRETDELRHTMPLTTYADYEPWLRKGADSLLPEAPAFWAYTSLGGGREKWVPFTEGAFNNLVNLAIGTAMLGCAEEKGEVLVGPGARVLYSLAPRPYLCGFLPEAMARRAGWHVMPPPEVPETLPFREAVEQGFQVALREGVDVIYGMASVLVTMADHLGEGSHRPRMSLKGQGPGSLYRVGRGLITSRLERRRLLPRDLWRSRGLVAWGTDTSFYRERIAHAWGKEPYEFLATSEMGVIALQGWGHRPGLVFSPFTAFLEFMPLPEWRRRQEDPTYTPTTVLLDEVEPGEVYHPVVTSFHGMPFVRYELGYLLRVLDDEGAPGPGGLPRFALLDRADGVIDLAGFTRLDRATVDEALARVGMGLRRRQARKGYDGSDPVLHLCLEAGPGDDHASLRQSIHQAIQDIDPSYRNLVELLHVDPLRLELVAHQEDVRREPTDPPAARRSSQPLETPVSTP